MSTDMEVMMNENQIATLVACMLSVAHIDGLRPEEDKLIQAFYADSLVEGMPAYKELDRNWEHAIEMLLQMQPSADFAERMVVMCAMTGQCDGDFTAAERAHVGKLALAAGVGEAKVEELFQFVKDSLLQSLSHLPDSGGVAALAQSL